jgi:23S rRNA pseudouridine2605 synthase
MPFDNNRNSRDGKSNRGGKPAFNRNPDRPQSKRYDSAAGSGRPPREDRPSNDSPYRKPGRSFSGDENPNRDNRPKKSFTYKKDDKPFKKDDRYKKENHYRKEEPSNRAERRSRPEKGGSFSKDGNRPERSGSFGNRPERSGSYSKDSNRPERNFSSDRRDDRSAKRPTSERSRAPRREESPQKERTYNPGEPELIRLNRYIANAGICSRRKADELIEAGVVSVNGEIVTSLGTKVNPAKDEVRYNNERLKREKMVYVLLNKPKDYITTTDDPQERRTVMQLVEKASRERIYPIGRLDRNTTGLLLMTNDGELADKLSHPRNSVTKIYQVELNKNLTQGDFNKIEYGLELEDGFIKPDSISYVQGASKKEVGIQIHSGKNRIVRRIFESLGYEVVKLDRVIYANLTKKDLPRGRWRHLDEKEVIQLKHFLK